MKNILNIIITIVISLGGATGITLIFLKWLTNLDIKYQENPIGIIYGFFVFLISLIVIAFIVSLIQVKISNKSQLK